MLTNVYNIISPERIWCNRAKFYWRMPRKSKRLLGSHWNVDGQSALDGCSFSTIDVVKSLHIWSMPFASMPFFGLCVWVCVCVRCSQSTWKKSSAHNFMRLTRAINNHRDDQITNFQLIYWRRLFIKITYLFCSDRATAATTPPPTANMQREQRTREEATKNVQPCSNQFIPNHFYINTYFMLLKPFGIVFEVE